MKHNTRRRKLKLRDLPTQQLITQEDAILIAQEESVELNALRDEWEWVQKLTTKELDKLKSRFAIANQSLVNYIDYVIHERSHVEGVRK